MRPFLILVLLLALVTESADAATVTATATATASKSVTVTPTAAVTATASVSPSITPSKSAAASVTVTRSVTRSSTLSPSGSPTAAWYTSLAAVTVLAGGGTAGCANGVGTNALFSILQGQIAVDSADRAYICDGYIVRVLDIATQAVTTLAGGGSACGQARGYANGIGSAALFADLKGVAVDETRGAVYVFDEGNQLIRVVDVATQAVTSLAGSFGDYYSNDDPYGDFIAQCNGPTIRGCHADGYGTSAAFKYLAGGAFDANGRLYFGDSGNQILQYIDVDSSLVQTFSYLYSAIRFERNADGIGSNARFHGMSWNSKAEGGVVICVWWWWCWWGVVV